MAGVTIVRGEFLGGCAGFAIGFLAFSPIAKTHARDEGAEPVADGVAGALAIGVNKECIVAGNNIIVHDLRINNHTIDVGFFGDLGAFHNFFVEATRKAVARYTIGYFTEAFVIGIIVDGGNGNASDARGLVEDIVVDGFCRTCPPSPRHKNPFNKFTPP